MPAEILGAAAQTVNVAAQAVRNASLVARAKDIASAHPIGAVAVGVVAGGLALFGGYKLMQKAFTPKV